MKNSFANLDGIDYTLADLSSKFSSSYLLGSIKGGGDKVYLIKGFLDAEGTSDRKHKVLVGSDQVNLKDFVVKGEIPDTGVTNYGNDVARYRRSTVRQFQRGLHDGVAIIRGSSGQPMGLSLGLAQSIFNKEFTAFDKATELVLSGKCSARALNSTYWIKKDSKDSIVIFRNNLRVGVHINNKFWPEACCSSIRTELKDDLGV